MRGSGALLGDRQAAAVFLQPSPALKASGSPSLLVSCPFLQVRSPSSRWQSLPEPRQAGRVA